METTITFRPLVPGHPERGASRLYEPSEAPEVQASYDFDKGETIADAVERAAEQLAQPDPWERRTVPASYSIPYQAFLSGEVVGIRPIEGRGTEVYLLRRVCAPRFEAIVIGKEV